MAKKYLYGAAVQGIQSFIFRTNVLREIVTASAEVQRICMSGEDGLFSQYEEPGGQSVIRAAGNVKYVFQTEAACRRAVLEFPKKVMNHAPGISVSQAVVMMENDADFQRASDELERKLREQRNHPSGSVRQFGLLGMQRVRRTGLPETVAGDCTSKKENHGRQDLARTMFGDDILQRARTSNSIEDFIGQNDWMAIIHADGNGLGQVVRAIAKDKDQFSLFSRTLDKATCVAARRAFEQLAEDQKVNARGIIPMRPVVLGGDDLTLICRGDLALDFVRAYLQCFEEETEARLGDILKANHLYGSRPHLTACAGVAFIKSAYPFHYGYDLAETLCGRAKADAKKKEHLVNGLAPSCLMFHKVQDSFIEDYASIVKRELQPTDGETFSFGPYYLLEMEGRWTIECLQKMAKKLDQSEEANAVKTYIRRWMGLKHESEGAAKEFLKRAESMCASSELRDLLKCATQEYKRNDIGKMAYVAYDLLAYHSILSQITK